MHIKRYTFKYHKNNTVSIYDTDTGRYTVARKTLYSDVECSTTRFHSTTRQSQTEDHGPRCCHLGSYYKRSKSSPVCPSDCNWYYCAHFIAILQGTKNVVSTKAACELRFSWAATSSNIIGL